MCSFLCNNSAYHSMERNESLDSKITSGLVFLGILRLKGSDVRKEQIPITAREEPTAGERAA